MALLFNNNAVQANGSSGSSNNQGGVPAGGSLPLAIKALPSITSAFGTAASLYMNSANTKRARENALLERQWQLQDRDHYELYNSPANQIARLRSAGINPLLSGGAANVSSGDTQALSATRPENPQLFDTAGLISSSGSNILASAISAKDLDIREDQLKLEGKKVKVEQDRLEMDKLNSEVDRALKESQKQVNYQQRALIQNQAAIYYKEAQHWEEKFNLQQKQTQADIDYKTALTKTENDFRELRKTHLQATIRNINANTALTNQQKQLAIKQCQEADQRLAQNLPKLTAQLMTHQIDAAYYAAQVAAFTSPTEIAAKAAENNAREAKAKSEQADIETYNNEDETTFGLLRTTSVFLRSIVGGMLGKALGN